MGSNPFIGTNMLIGYIKEKRQVLIPGAFSFWSVFYFGTIETCDLNKWANCVKDISYTWQH